MNESDKCIHCGKLEADKDHASACPSIIDRHPFEPMATEETMPECLSYSGGCEGDSSGLEHERHCPMYGKEFATYKDAFYAGQDAALERAAQVAENEPRSWDANAPDPQHRIAEQIRALKGSR